ncbi:MAG TPA: HAMP domain-containing sensor histidine kinase [bacterium]|nr:HAMP domain-containing sensor histidine kinase [bacterium]
MRVGSRVAVVHASVVAALVAAGSFVFLLAAERALDGEMSARTRAVARISAQRLDAAWLPGLERGEPAMRTLANGALAQIANAAGGARVVMLDRDGRVLAASDPAWAPPGERFAGLALDAFEASEASAGRAALSPPYQAQDGVWYQSAWVPAGANGDALGAELEVQWRAPLERLRRAVALFAVLSAAAAAVVGAFLARGITRRLARLADAMADVGASGLPRRAGVTGSDEVGALGARFDALVAALERHDEELRELSATVAHEVRNPLGAMTGYSELLARKVPDPEVARLTAGIREEIAALERLVGRFLRFAGEVRVQRTRVELSEMIDDAVRGALGPETRMKIERHFEPVPPVEADADLLREVFVNLVRNASQATKDQGTLRLVVAPGGPGVVARVEDDGPGVDATIRARLFQPFQTTKADGIGLGLAICRRIVVAHGGTIECESGSGGTAFVVGLPAASASP